MLRAGFTALMIVLCTVSCSTSTVNRMPMSEEERAFRANCRACHKLPDPVSLSNEQWAEVVARHAEKTFSLSAEDQAKILKFLQESNE